MGLPVPPRLLLRMALAFVLAHGCAGVGSGPAIAEAPASQAWVGVAYSGTPSGVRTGSSALLGSVGGASYGLAEMSGDAGRMVWLQERIGHDAAGKARWKVLAVLDVPPLEAGELVLLGRGWCFAGETSPEVVAVVAGGSPSPRPRLLWAPRPAEQRFEPLSPAGIVCPAPEEETE